MKRSLSDFLDACTPSDSDITRFVLYSIDAGKQTQHKIYKSKPSESDIEDEVSDLDGFRLYYQVQNGKSWDSIETFQRKKLASDIQQASEHTGYPAICIRLMESNELMIREMTRGFTAITTAYTDSLTREQKTATEYQELKDALAEALSESQQETDTNVGEVLLHLNNLADKIGIGK